MIRVGACCHDHYHYKFLMKPVDSMVLKKSFSWVGRKLQDRESRTSEWNSDTSILNSYKTGIYSIWWKSSLFSLIVKANQSFACLPIYTIKKYCLMFWDLEYIFILEIFQTCNNNSETWFIEIEWEGMARPFYYSI